MFPSFHLMDSGHMHIHIVGDPLVDRVQTSSKQFANLPGFIWSSLLLVTRLEPWGGASGMALGSTSTTQKVLEFAKAWLNHKSKALIWSSHGSFITQVKTTGQFM